jgi:hypothetical protein
MGIAHVIYVDIYIYALHVHGTIEGEKAGKKERDREKRVKEDSFV